MTNSYGLGWRLAVVLLWLAVLASALAVVRSSHEARSELNRLEILRREASQLHERWGQYLLEQSAWSAYGRIEKEATEKLHMVVPQDDQLIMVAK